MTHTANARKNDRRLNAEKARLTELGAGWHFVWNGACERVLVYIPQGDK